MIINLSDIKEILTFIKDLIVKRKKVPLKDVKITNGQRNSIEVVCTNETGYVYSTNLDISFSGPFGKNPKIIMIFSHNTDTVSYETREEIDSNIIKSKRDFFKYHFTFSKQYSYLNDEISVTKPYLIIVEGKKNIGFGYIISEENAFELIKKEGNGFHPIPLNNPGIFSKHITFKQSLNDVVLQCSGIKEKDIKAFAKIEDLFKDCFFNHNN